MLYSSLAAVALGIPLFDEALDLSLHYRPAVARYRADESSAIEHGAGADLVATLSDSLTAAASGEFVTGRDVQMVFAQGV